MDIDYRAAACAACDLTARLQVELRAARAAMADWERRRMAVVGGDRATQAERLRQEQILLREQLDGVLDLIEELACEHPEETHADETHDVAA